MDVFKVPPFDDDMRRPAGARTALEAYQAAAWRAPAATRFDSRPANDFAANDVLIRAGTVAPQSTLDPMQMAPMPRWLVFVIGAIIAAVMGGLLGGALAVY
ncbi:hypothetical protein [Brevundimonas sp.]|jgi:hypothetical protein|uniref:hypothetical protein n=1 Tax=Brevundimonas sp. TaxID=1871086 RepID=UPI00391A06AF|nr:hypothetical protein [Brevundimonas sp.]